MKGKFGMKCVVALAPLVLLLSAAISLAAAARTVDAGAKWEVAETTTLSELTIGADASITAPEGRSLTMTVDEVETPIKAGTYKGVVVLTLPRIYNTGAVRTAIWVGDDSANMTKKGSKWFVNKTSYLTGLTIGEESHV